MAKKIVFINQKGGVGKTTTAFNVADCLTRAGKRVLSLDLDAQCNLSQYFKVFNPDSDKPTIYTLLTSVLTRNSLPAKQAVVSTKYGDVIPGSIECSFADYKLGGVNFRETLLKKAIEPIENEYEYIIIDCPPALGILSVNALIFADTVVIPFKPEFMSLPGVKMLLESIKDIQAGNEKLKVACILFTMHEPKLVQAQEVRQVLESQYKKIKICDVTIRKNVKISETFAPRESIFNYAPGTPGAKDYQAFTNLIVKGVI